MRRNRIEEPKILHNMSGAAAQRRGQNALRKMALILAFVVGFVALYYCLLPAMAGTADGNVYVYFQNSLAKYDKVECSVNGGEYAEMILLSSGDATEAMQPVVAAGEEDHINKDTIYVLPTPVAPGATVKFRGTDSGTVYDTTVNYRINTASTEWGYDYHDFTWESEALILSEASNCYYAPPLLMQYKYAGYAATSKDGDVELVQYIYPHGEKNADGQPIAKAYRTTTSIIQPNTADNRTFWDALYPMEGYMNAVNRVYDLSNNSQSGTSSYEGSVDIRQDSDKGIAEGTDVYHATAQFFDYYSDWEMAGIPLQNHEQIYAQVNDACTPQVLHEADFEAADDFDGFVKNGSFNSATDNFIISTDQYHSGSSSLRVEDYGASGAALLDISSYNIQAEQLYTLSLWVYSYNPEDGSSPYEDGETMNIRFLNSSLEEIDKSMRLSVTAKVGEWIQIEDTFSFSGDVMPAYLEVGSSRYGNFHLDDVKFSTQANYYNPKGTFSEGTNRISYAYQGVGWNSAISDYYTKIKAEMGKSAFPLYFASNSWLTGNGRYNLEDTRGQALYSQEAVEAGEIFVTEKNRNGEDIMSYDTRNGVAGAYLFPYERQYLKDLFGFNQNPDTPYVTVEEMNIPFGQSMSRGVPGLVTLVQKPQEDGTTVDELQLGDTGVETPYFNEEFILGDNPDNAVLGAVYNDVAFDFKKNGDYYEYDSTNYIYATRVSKNANTGEYYMRYTGGGVTKADADEEDQNGSSQTKNQFYPFNSTATNGTYATENLMFGMKLDIPFNMYREAGKRNKSLFKFSGDDDVWVYVDGSPALDIGGTHTAVGGVIDLQTGYAVTGSTYDENTGEVVYNAGSTDWTNFVDGKNAEDTGISDVEKAAFAIGTNDGIKDRSWTHFTSASFFDQTYTADEEISNSKSSTWGYKTSVDTENGLYKVMYKYWDSSSVQHTGAAVFKLNTITMKTDTTSDTDLENHTLSIYYMERGLNSSNFKLAFNFVPHTEREVTKVWEDADLVDHSNDSIDVELYRTVPEEKEVTEEVQVQTGTETRQADSQWPENLSYVRIQGFNGTTYQKNGRFVETGTAFNNNVFFDKVNDGSEDVDSNVYLTLNGINLSWASYSDLKADANLGLKITLGNTEITEANFGSDSTGSYLIVPAGNQIRFTFNAVSGTREAGTTADNEWGIDTANGWLIDARAYLRDSSGNSGNAVKITGKFQNPPGTDSYMDADTGRIYSDRDGDEYTPMNFLIVKRTRYYNDPGYYKYYYDVLATPTGENVEITSTVKTVKTSDAIKVSNCRYVGTKIADFSGVLTASPASYTSDGIGYFYATVPKDNSTDGYVGFYNCDTERTEASLAPGKGWEYNINSISGDKFLELVAADRNGNLNTYSKWGSIDGLTFTRTYNYTVPIYETQQQTDTKIVYSDAFLLDTVTLNADNLPTAWHHLWNDIIESVEYEQEDGTYKKYEYKYFIREVDINSEHANNGGKYITNYYELDENGNPVGTISPEKIVYGETNETLELYPIDHETGAIQISNMPCIDLDLTKQWRGTADEDKKEVIVDIYNSLGSRVQTVYMNSAGSWAAAVQNLPLYGTNADGELEKITYYGVERSLSGFIPSYSTPETSITIAGTPVTVYPFGANNSLQVTNRPDNSGLFSFQLLKVSSENTTDLLEGAEFKLEISEDGTTFTTLFEKIATDADGTFDFGDLEASGKYYRLTETKSAVGHQLCTSPIVFQVTADSYNNLSFTESNITEKDDAIFHAYTWNEKTDTLEITLKNDVKGVVIPNTGGSGVQPFLLGGSAVMILFLIGFVIRRKVSA